MPNKMSDIFLSDEDVLWEGKPNVICFLLRGVGRYILFLILWTAFAIYLASSVFAGGIFNSTHSFAHVAFLLVLIPYSAFLGKIILNAAEYRNVRYAITDKRIICRTGLFGVDFNTVSYADVSNIITNVSPFENVCGVGSVYVISASGYGTTLMSIKEPYTVSKIANEAFTETKLEF